MKVSRKKPASPLNELETARAVWLEADAEFTALNDRILGLGVALGSSKDGVIDPRVLDDHRTKAEPFMELLSRRRGREKATKALIDAREKREDALPAYQDAKLVWEGAQRKRTNEIASTLQPRQIAAVKKIASALEMLSESIAEEHAVRDELKATAPLPTSAKLQDLSGDLFDMAISEWHSTAWHWSQKIQKLGVI